MKTVDVKGWELNVGDRVHIDSDSEEWGRVASHGTVVNLFGDEVQVEIDSIRATLTVSTQDVDLRKKSNVYSRHTHRSA